MNAITYQNHIQRLTASERQLQALAWRLAHTAARAAAASVLGRDDEALDDIAAGAAARTLAHPGIVLTEEAVLGGRTLGRLAAAAGRRAALDERRARSGRRSGSQRRCDPLRRADRLPLEAALGVSGGPDPEMQVISREAEAEMARMRIAAERLPRAQRDAIAARLAGRSPASPAQRQALRAAVSRLRAIMGVQMPA